jgi:hypothetical protein
MTIKRPLLATLVTLALASPTSAYAAAHIVIVNGNAPGVGFNDPTPAAPVGGNPGTTLGTQRLAAFQFAADVWGANLDSAAEVQIFATFEPLTCTATSAVLGSAGALSVFRDFPGAPLASTWYSSALTAKLVGFDVTPGSGTIGADIRARFNSNLGNAGCLTGTGWYLGFDTNHGSSIDLVTVLLHEFAHGLGFQTFVGLTTGAPLAGFSDAYMHLMYDDTTGKAWEAMTNAERIASSKNPRHVVVTGPAVTAAVPTVLQVGTPLLRVTSPGTIAGAYAIGSAAFGPPLSSPGVIGQVVLGLDPANAAGPSTTDGCSPFTNASAMAGKIVIVDRGTCGFIVKVKNAQDAGAVGAIIADNVAGAPPAGLGGADPTITIPSVRVSLADGITIKGQLAGGVTAALGIDLGTRAGADDAGRALLFTPDPTQSGSSLSHWDTIATRNQLMEPAINDDLTHSVKPPEDLTKPMLRDIGWYPDADLDLVNDEVDACLGSDLRGTVFVGGENTGVPNTFFTNGCTITDLIAAQAVGATNHGGFVSGVAQLLNDLRKADIITGSQKGTLQSAAARASIP